jgi:hypothetical protein
MEEYTYEWLQEFVESHGVFKATTFARRCGECVLCTNNMKFIMDYANKA